MSKANKQPPAAELNIGAVKIVRAFRPGDVVFLETVQPLRAEAMQHINAQFKAMIPDVRVVVLQAGLKVAGREEDAPLPLVRRCECCGVNHPEDHPCEGPA